MKLPANWKTSVSMIGGTLMGALTWLSTLSYDQGPIAMVIPIEYKGKITLIAGIASLALFCWNGLQQKDKNVTGGSVAQTLDGSVAKPGTQTMVDITKETTEASARL